MPKTGSSSAMAERPRELDRRFQGAGQFEAKFETEGLTFAPLRQDATYVYLLNMLMFTFRMVHYGHIKMAFYAIKRPVHIIGSVQIVYNRLRHHK